LNATPLRKFYPNNGLNTLINYALSVVHALSPCKAQQHFAKAEDKKLTGLKRFPQTLKTKYLGTMAERKSLH
jgi:hypothetical protein